MRLRTPLPLCSLCLAATAVLAPVAPAVARAGNDPSCAGADDKAFPLTAKIHGGPASFEPGGGFGTWYLDLTNTTRITCAGVHPVVVLVDDKRVLQPSQPQLEFYDGSRTRPVRFETTDEHELVGVLDGSGFSGFSVAPGRAVTVKLRLSMTSDALPNEITANAAVVQRHDADGDWIGESNSYRFKIGDGGGGEESASPPTGEPEATVTASVTAEAPTPALSAPATASSASPESGLPSAEESGGTDTDEDTGEVFEAGEEGERETDRDGRWEGRHDWASGHGPRAEELAHTGSGAAPRLLAAGMALAAGCAAFLLARSRRR
ncbi:hypothetical protein [Streptomyces sp. NPDC058964]|uniref:hypothetical protein n=1 Tax=Streptomyces sp. NPDC058964 TaxID=3346681 RepID=UPI0036AF9C6A